MIIETAEQVTDSLDLDMCNKVIFRHKNVTVEFDYNNKYIYPVLSDEELRDLLEPHFEADALDDFEGPEMFLRFLGIEDPIGWCEERDWNDDGVLDISYNDFDTSYEFQDEMKFMIKTIFELCDNKVAWNKKFK